MSTIALATIIAIVTIVVLTVLIVWLKSARRSKQDMYAKSAEYVLNPSRGPGNLGKGRVVGKAPELGYGYNTKGRRFPKPTPAPSARRRDEDDAHGVVTHPNIFVDAAHPAAFKDELDRLEDKGAQNHVEGGDRGTRDHDGFVTGGGFGGDNDFRTGGGFGGSDDSHSSSSSSYDSGSSDSGSSSSDSGGGGGSD